MPAALSSAIRSASTCTCSAMRRTSTRPPPRRANSSSRCRPTSSVGGAETPGRGRRRGRAAQLVEAGDRVAVRRDGRVVEQLHELALHRLAHHVLPAAGLGVHELPLEPDHVDEQPLGQPVLAHHRHRAAAAGVGQLEVPVAGHHHQPVALHPGHGLAHRRPALAEALGDPGAQRDDALLLELVDRPEVHLGGIDELVHAASPFGRPHPIRLADGPAPAHRARIPAGWPVIASGRIRAVLEPGGGVRGCGSTMSGDTVTRRAAVVWTPEFLELRPRRRPPAGPGPAGPDHAAGHRARRAGGRRAAGARAGPGRGGAAGARARRT